MAKQIEELLIRLKTDGYEEVTKLKSAFRGLESALGQSDRGLSEVREGLLKLANNSQRSEALLKGLESAFKSLRSQATLHSPVYTQLTQDIKELSAAQREYIVDLNSTKSAYASLAVAEEGAARRAAKLRNIQQLAVENNPLVVAGRRPTEFGAVPQVAPGPGGVFIAPPYRSTPYSPGTQYDRPIGPQPVSQQVRAAERAVEQAMQGINDAMERSLNERAKLQEKYQQRQYDQLLEGLDLEGKARKQAFDRELADFDARLAATEKRRKRGLSGIQVTQIAGAAISGGIFGGPEGFLGGVAGGVLGGVGGAFAGAAIGAQVAAFRQAAGGAAEYAAAINQQRRALSGVVEDNAAYQQSLAFIDQTSRQLAIPQEQVTRNFTRLSASVLGAGGNVEAAQEAFLGIAAGIRGTGGSLADLDAALLATAQVFSKGKVSAEELRGQIGERLPGAFTLFAQAVGKTPAELDKALEQGEVGLRDFQKFVALLSTDYGQKALALAASSEAAGDRLATAWGRAQERLGKALQPIGAEFQELAVRLLESLEPVVTDLLPKLGQAALAVAKNIEPLLAALGVLGGAALVAAIAQVGGLAAAFVTLKDAVLASNAALLLNPWVALAAGVAAFAAVLTKAALAQRELNQLINNGTGTTAQLAEAKSDLNNKLAEEESRLARAKDKYGENGRVVASLEKRVRELRAQLEQINRTYSVRIRLEQEGYTFDAKGGVGTFQVAGVGTFDASGKFLYGPQKAPSLPDSGAGTAKEKKGPKPPKDRTVELVAQLELSKLINNQENAIRDALFAGDLIRAAQLETGKEQLQIQYERNRALRAANYESEKEAIRAQALENIDNSRVKLNDRLRDINKDRLLQQIELDKITREAVKPIEAALKAREQDIENNKEYARLIMEGLLPSEAKRIVNFNNLIRLQQELNEEKIKELEISLAAVPADSKEAKDLKERIDALKEARKAIEASAAGGAPPGESDIDRITDKVTELKGELNELTNFANIAIRSATFIGDAFANAFQNLITGAGSARQVLSDFFKEVSQGFLKMAAEIIAKQTTMIILQTILRALGAVAGGSSGAAAPVDGVQSGTDFNLGEVITTGIRAAAKGDAFTADGPVERYAKGGIVKRPTMFAYAKGGTFNPGVMGEAGPEAILPLRRTPDGRLGVTQVQPQGGNRLRESMQRSGYSSAGSTNINMSFQTTRFMDREWVDREQLEVAMAKAAKDGGAQGEKRALAKLQNSPRTRNRLALR